MYANDGPINPDRGPAYGDLFYEPFYQMMRQQFLAHEMEKVGELGAEVVTVVHISPAQNKELRKVTSPGLTSLGDAATAVWKSLLRTPDRFIPVHTEELFAAFDPKAFPKLIRWHDYMEERYPFLAL